MSEHQATDTDEDISGEEEVEEIVYAGLEVDHRDNTDAPDLYVLTAEAGILADWAKVPRANPDFMDGYQRQLDENRLDEIEDFFGESVNIIPGAILVTVDEENLLIDSNDHYTEITIQNPPPKSSKELLETAYEELYERLDDRGQDHVDAIAGDEEEDEDKDTAEEADSDEDEAESDDDSSPVSYLSRKTGELKKKIENWDDLGTDEKDSLGEYAKRVNKPGLIIDGQHRVHGAKQYPGDIQYPVVLIPGLEAKEQVYHFYMINDKAEPISQEELLITVSTALSEKESDDLMMRLLSAGVDVDKARYPYMADVEEQSPFHQMINYEEKVGEQTGSIGFRDLYTIMNRFVDMKGGHHALYEDIDEWDDVRYRIGKFYTFWTAIKDHYPDLWEDAEKAQEGNYTEDDHPKQFFRKDAMRVLQEYILERLVDKQKSRKEVLEELGEVDDSVKEGLWELILEDDDIFTEEIQNVLDDIPEDFYRKKWQTSGLSTSENRNNFKEELKKAADTTPKGLPKLRIFNKGF